MKILPPGADHGQQFSKPLPIFVHHFKLSLKFRKSSKWWTKIHTRLSEEEAGTKADRINSDRLGSNKKIKIK